jgi:predicted Na+-dependent transporter
MPVDWNKAIEVLGSVLLFCLVFGMSATVDIGCLWAQLHNRKAIATGLFLQFVTLPFLGFLVVNLMKLDKATGLTLLVVTSSPGGSYSNWWCSMFNADLALSVTMTAISTILSIVTLPVNLLIYAKLTYEDDVIAIIDWGGLFVSLTVVILAISFGLLASYHFNSHNFNFQMNRLGNGAGLSLILFSGALSNSNSETQLWDRDWKFFVAVAAPAVLGLILANVISTGASLLKPERVTVSIECVYQNVGIATSVALAMFDGDELAEAIGVPFYYGCVEAIIISLYCLAAWKCGWTKAPKDVSLWTAISTSYEILAVEQAERDQDGVLVDHPNRDEQFQYVEHTELGEVGGRHDIVTPSDGGSPIRRTPILNKGPKEPSHIEVPPVPRLR